MLQPTKDFYNLTKVDRVIDTGESNPDTPVTHIKVFHKEYPRMPRITMPEVRLEGAFDELLRNRESNRVFTDLPVDLSVLARVLKSCRIVDADRDPEKSTYPSAGARFPVEIYVIAFRVDGLDSGCYHYQMSAEALELLWKQDLSARDAEIRGGDSVLRPCSRLASHIASDPRINSCGAHRPTAASGGVYRLHTTRI